MGMTRDEWRPGRRSRMAAPRQRNWGGAQELPLALALAAQRTWFGAPGAQRLCRHCGGPAMRDLPVCRIHGGASVAARRGQGRPGRPGEDGDKP